MNNHAQTSAKPMIAHAGDSPEAIDWIEVTVSQIGSPTKKTIAQNFASLLRGPRRDARNSPSPKARKTPSPIRTSPAAVSPEATK
jgi:hypothetical protein